MQALDLFTNLKPSKGTLMAYKVLRKYVKHLDPDRELHRGIGTVANLIDDGSILHAVKNAVGELM